MQVCFCLIHQGRRETGEADRAPELAKTRACPLAALEIGALKVSVENRPASNNLRGPGLGAHLPPPAATIKNSLGEHQKHVSGQATRRVISRSEADNRFGGCISFGVLIQFARIAFSFSISTGTLLWPAVLCESWTPEYPKK
jgi:hypothetical protein